MVWRRVATAVAVGFLAASCASGHAPVPAHPNRFPQSSSSATALSGSSHSVELTGFHVLDISFVDDRHGFALGGFTSALVTAVLATADGGMHWKTVAPTPHPEAHIEFSTPRLGWAYGPDLYVTTDGGQTWEQQHAGGPPVAVAAQGRSVWAVTGTCHVGRCTFQLHISKDAGQTWETPPLPAAASDWHAEVSRVEDVGWIVGSTDTRHGEVALLRTTDGGRTWKRLPDPCDRWFHYGTPFKPVFEAHLAPIDAEHVWLRCTDEPVGGSSRGVLFTSADAGASWHLALLGPSANELHLAAITQTSGWETDSTAGPWLRPLSVDGRFHPRTVKRQVAWSDLQFVDAETGWASSGRLVYETTDGGRRWLPVSLHPSGCG